MFKCTFRYLKRTSPTDTEWVNEIKIFDARDGAELQKIIDEFCKDDKNKTQFHTKLIDVARL